jgi:2-methylcitrate dehydratase PrpD
LPASVALFARPADAYGNFAKGGRVLHNPGVTEVMAKFVVDTRWDDLPLQVTHQAKRSLMNFFAVALTGCRDQTFETALQTLAAFSGGKQAALIGRRERIDALSAAFLNAAGANVLDFCDTHVPAAIHPTAPLRPRCWRLPSSNQ